MTDPIVTTTTTTSPAYLTLPKTDLYKDAKNRVYRLGEEGGTLNANGLTVRETDITVGLGGDTLEIVQISDAHIGYNTVSKMRWKNCLSYAENFDYMLMTGDMIEGLTNDLAGYYKDTLAPYDNVMMVLGNHEWIKGEDSCPEDMGERYKKLQSYFKNDVYYSSVVLKNKVMLIQMDNSQEKFWDHQIPKLRNDLNTARSKGYAVLLFVHVPLGTNNPNEHDINAIYSTDTPAHSQHVSFVNLTPGPKSKDAASQEVYELITNSADVIKGVFGGHMHSHFYTEICAKTPDGTDTVIPQYVSHKANFDGGHVLKINVK